MCDTLGCVSAKLPIFGKNSDRLVDEPQVTEFYPRKNNSESVFKATYLEVEQSPVSYAVLLSRPVWMYGAEMGINEYGVSIGNEAVFTKGKYNKTGLTGMDLLRIALERSVDAKEALNTIIELLERYGQGGNCGYLKDMYYNNSFLIMDRKELYVLETYDKQWAYRKRERDSISNRLSIRKEGKRNQDKSCDFTKTYSEPVYTYLCGSGERRCTTLEALERDCSLSDFKAALRTHTDIKDPFNAGTQKSVCMHGGGFVDSQTTASVIYQLYDTPVIWTTNSSLACVSLFKPYLFGTKAPYIYQPEDPKALEYWQQKERLNRRMLGNKPPQEYYQKIAELEAEWEREVLLNYSDEKAMQELSETVFKQEVDFLKQMDKQIATQSKPTIWHMGFWKNKKV